MQETSHSFERRNGRSIDGSKTPTLPRLKYFPEQFMSVVVPSLQGEVRGQLIAVVVDWVLRMRGWSVRGHVLISRIENGRGEDRSL